MSEHAELQTEELKHHGDALQAVVEGNRADPAPANASDEPEPRSTEKE